MKPPLKSSDRRLLAALAVRVLEAEPHERESIIAAATAGRPDLREAAVGLTDGAPSAAKPDPIDDLAELFEMAAAGEVGDPPDLSGTTIGSYRLIRRIGLGAYGAVYVAERTRRPTRRFALKLLHPGVASPGSIRRFIREQRVLASLDHPGVARLLDARSAPNGCPYFVMHLIDGPSLRGFCRRRSPPLIDRVGLIAQVCDAVRHVHEKGIVHRDLKPGNILIQFVDGRPQPIVIDFGVVRLIDRGPGLDSTTLGRPMGTQRYMSPEQRLGGAIDARCDIYSLGVTMAEVLPAAPVPTVRSGRGPTPRTQRLDVLTSTLPAELRRIIDRCTRDRPDDRYQRVADLAGDLRRFIDGEAEVRGPGPP